MASKHTRVSRRMLFIYGMLCGLILLLLPELTGKIQLTFVRVFRWPLSMGGNFTLANPEQMLEDAVPRSEFDRMQIHCDNLEETLRLQREKFQKLYGLYNTFIWEGIDFVVADIVTASSDPARSELAVTYRKNKGLVAGQYVLGDNSVIGTVSDFSGGTAHVRLFTDPSSSIPVSIGGVERMMQGNGDNSAKVPLLPSSLKIQVGDKVYASNNRTEFLDAPVRVGTVAQVKTSRKDPLLLDVTVKPACEIEKLENVAIIIMNPQK